MIGYIIFFIALSGLLLYIFDTKKELEMNKIDITLYRAALEINKELKSEFHERAVDKNSISKEEHNRNNIKLTELRKKWKLIYLYTAVESEGKIYLTSSSVTDIDMKNRTAAQYYYDYDDASSDLVKSLREN